jgi:hypothetical protein
MEHSLMREVLHGPSRITVTKRSEISCNFSYRPLHSRPYVGFVTAMLIWTVGMLGDVAATLALRRAFVGLCDHVSMVLLLRLRVVHLMTL